MKTLRIAPILCFLLLLTRTASADEVRLANGDRLTGTVVSLSGGTLIFKTPHGDLKLPWADVTSLTMDHALLVKTATGPAQMIAVNTASGGPPLASIVEIQTPAPPLQLTGGASAGLLTTGGNTDVNSVRLDGELTARTPRDRYSATGVVNRAHDNGRATAENWTTSFGYDRFLTKALFATASTILTNDRFRDLDLRAAIGAGLGYQVWDTPRGVLTLSGGIGYVTEHFEAAPDDSYTALREGVKLDVFLSAKRVQLFHHHDGYFGVTGDDNLFFRAQNGIRLAIAAGLVSTAQIDTDYDRSPAPGLAHTDRSFALTFGYRF